jgi:hypothetical protein
MFTIVIFIFLLANLPAYSIPIDSADANYCLDLNDERPMIVFEKKNNDLKPILLNMQEFSKYRYYTSDTSTNFKFTTGRITCDDFYILARLNGYNPQEISKLSQIIQANFPKYETISFVEGRRKKEELLLFKGQIIDANVKISIRSLPNLDTTFNIPFRVRITGECPKEIRIVEK